MLHSFDGPWMMFDAVSEQFGYSMMFTLETDRGRPRAQGLRTGGVSSSKTTCAHVGAFFQRAPQSSPQSGPRATEIACSKMQEEQYV